MSKQEKPGGGYRTVTCCYGRLRDVHITIKEEYLSKIPIPEWLYGAGDGRGTRENAKAHQGKKHHFVTDLKSFFPRTSHGRVYRVFTSVLGFTPDAARIATRLTTYDGGLPQGTHTSPRLADLAFLQVDRQLDQFCKQERITYTRYVDDLSFSSPHPFQSRVPEIKAIINDGNNRYRVHQGAKTYYTTGPVEITGIVVYNNRIRVPKVLIDRWSQLPPESPEWQGLHNYILHVERG